MQETCKLIWPRCLVAPDPWSTPTLSNLPHCPFCSSDTPRLSATWLFFICNFDIFHSVLLTTGVTAQSSRQSRHPLIEEDPGLYPPAGIYCCPTCGYDGNVMSAATYALLQNLCRTSDLWATSRRLMFLAGVFMRQPSEKGFLSTRPRETKSDLGL